MHRQSGSRVWTMPEYCYVRVCLRFVYLANIWNMWCVPGAILSSLEGRYYCPSHFTKERTEVTQLVSDR